MESIPLELGAVRRSNLSTACRMDLLAQVDVSKWSCSAASRILAMSSGETLICKNSVLAIAKLPVLQCVSLLSREYTQ